ncbi:MAG: class I SAM-dependent methyltransferase [Chitinivibrionales bacterium]|nr:class I SAM-dependent methyltransferase [Chitinivibrionales bacterium]
MKKSIFASPAAKRAYNRMIFALIAPRYHQITGLLSFGRDRVWKRHLIGRLPNVNGACIIDLAAGTGDLTQALAKQYPDARILGADLSWPMATIGVQTTTGRFVRFSLQDMGSTGIKSNRADIITGGYALRNAPDLSQTIVEISRLLKTGGTAAFLDFSHHPQKFLAAFQFILLYFWGGFWGLIMHAKPAVYTYIAKSLRRFPDRKALRSQLESAGLIITHEKPFMAGMISVIICRKT